MRYASVCSGIEAASIAWRSLGWEPAWLSEIEPFPCAVLEQRHPGVPNLGDMTKITEADIEKHGRIDLLVGGTPCQSFSVAGLRGGLDDPRGNLALRFFQLAHVARPRWVVWENVPGVLSSDGGKDFGSILGALGELGYGFAYRILDAQFVRVDTHARAVPQRRRRVFVVGCLGDWRSAAAVLLEREGLRWDPAPSRAAGEGTSGVAAKSLRARGNTSHREDSDTYIPDQSLCLNAGGMGRIDAESETLIVFDERNVTSKANRTRVEPGLPCPTMHSSPMTVAFNWQAGGSRDMTCPGEIPTAIGRHQTPAMMNHYGVRRLTPRECERLQGFPDDYTLVKYRSKPAADGPRYRALGNSMATNVMRWIGQRIEMVDRVLMEVA